MPDEMTYRRAAQTPAGDSMSVAFIYADFGLAFFESTDICPVRSYAHPPTRQFRKW